MWPVSRVSSTAFNSLPCPYEDRCLLPYCLFSHEGNFTPANFQAPANLMSSNATGSSTAHVQTPATAKTPRGDPSSEHFKTPAQPEQDIETAKLQIFVGFTSKNGDKKVQSTSKTTAPDRQNGDALPSAATRPISPPPIKRTADTAPPTPEVNVPLMPRKLTHEPATWARRLTLLKHLHQFMTSHNDKIKRAVKPEIQALQLSANQLNKLAVDEEEKIAREHGPVYENVLKQRFVAIKNMTIQEWVKSRMQAIAKEKDVDKTNPAGKIEPQKRGPYKRVETGLIPKDEVIILSTLKSPEHILAVHGVVTKVPTQAELEEAQAAQDSADFWEICDRCDTRFQVFPERREGDGALTTKDPCQHHWGRKYFPKTPRGHAKEPTRMSCCNEPLGSPGCTSLETHVFKLNDAIRMSLVMPFIETPENDKADPNIGVCFDCEMGYTTHGLDLIRLTAVAWPSHRPLVDVLVRPKGHILDPNTRFSGVTMEQILDGKPFDPDNPKPKRNDLRVVDLPQARALLLAHISPETPLIGHAIENDLNVVRLVHPTIVDTAILFPHFKGPPFRMGLRALAQKHLNMEIQQGGAAGHDSYEDAKATGELVRFKVAQEWKRMQSEGWFVTGEGAFPPMPPGPAPEAQAAPPAPSMVSMNGPAEEKKRKRDNEDDTLDEAPLDKK